MLHLKLTPDAFASVAVALCMYQGTRREHLQDDQTEEKTFSCIRPSSACPSHTHFVRGVPRNPTIKKTALGADSQSITRFGIPRN